MKKRGKIPVFYSYIVEAMLNYQIDSIGTIPIKKAIWLLGRYRVPKSLQVPVFYEMMEYGLITKIDRYTASIRLKIEDKPSSNLSKVYHQCGVW